MTTSDDFRAAGNPMFNGNKLKLGVFGTNCSSACAITTAESTFEPTFEHNVEIAKKLEAAGWECMVPIARWRGFGGPTNFNGVNMDTFTWAAALAAVTTKLQFFSTTHIPTLNPIVATKMATTIDNISKGRYGLNLVTGWFTPEMEMFGVPMMEHDTRYEYATEWMEIVESLWTKNGVTFDGQFLKVKDAFSEPKPYNKETGRPVLICAGSSGKGLHFTAKFCDFNFGFMQDMESGAAWVKKVKELAREEYKRELGTFTACPVVVRETEKEARDYYDYYVNQKGDWEACENICEVLQVQSQNHSAEMYQKFKERFIAGWGGYPIVGTPEQVADKLVALSNTGVDGALLTMVDYNEELPFFNDRVMPLLKQAGLRN
ncbi:MULTISPECIES: LLM class flavin-dependent oxidoreductase [Rhizobiaceae]|uniref:Alkanesulfonate monooxygenase SsuD/methylene tetrahydromethanopterin reductase-like flavin-dependent oxidoreductase (Luciferase family) n=3 Tax=Rhizobiaceae TaxID=82115 RepID=A0A6P1C310_RHITR|nr:MULTISPECIES: LLM class flavin-dependent oxidoreductase [Rhizobiaceae]AEI89634.1 monooxygenase protein [Sinorhizobium fredii GR64]AGB73247.1 putative luciferase-like monooxygenase [Rhizobium tropici CIAT 899]MBB4243541.1 alkanesulfonate monooxygenase SsuD/methylene tetrahydromethanopterin reductase-like flavin-dependent oxidoreductase (luciferase family) [Rhizobium tropici]MBB5595554.1 alkanesulfonate monooxygenase SsuD/methylene tetrahydromethanopterin reductase-like flavin-dependent oxidor